MTDSASGAENYCYRHPDRQSFMLCQRCGRTICAECQTQAPVGVHCPECVREARQSAPKTKPAVLSAIGRARRGDSAVTFSIIGVTVVVYLLQLLSGGLVTSALMYWPPLTEVQPWRMLTSVLVHSQGSFLHILFNMYALFLFGRLIEPMLGRWRFLALYLISGFGGSVAVLLMEPMMSVVGASGAVFGLMGAFFVLQRSLGGTNVQLLIVLGINLVIGFVVPGIAWQAHLGGLAAGALVALVLLKTRRRDQQRRQWMLVGTVALGLLVLTVVGVQLMYWRLT